MSRLSILIITEYSKNNVQEILVILLLIAAVSYLGYRGYKSYTKKKCGDGDCGCD